MIYVKRILLVVALSGIGLAASAQKAGDVELGIGVGDQLFEKVVWHDKTQPFGLLPESETIIVDEDYRHSQHWFIDGIYRCGKVIGVGGMVDYSHVSWHNRDYNGNGKLLEDNGKEHFTNIVVMPYFMVNYMNKKYVSLHSGLGAGLGINTGTETDYLGRRTEYSPAFYLNLIGIRGMYSRYYASFDLGGMVSMKSTNQMYMFGSRLFSISVGIIL